MRTLEINWRSLKFLLGVVLDVYLFAFHRETGALILVLGRGRRGARPRAEPGTG